LVENDLVAEEILIANYSCSAANVDSLKGIQEHRLTGGLGIVLSDGFFSHERKNGIIDYMLQELADGKLFALAIAGVHTKITLIKTTCGQHIVIGGSANLRSSLNVESITIDNCPTLYNFHRTWIRGIISKYLVKHKMLRRNPLWESMEDTWQTHTQANAEQ
jgi:hypothetical protein